MQWPREVTTRVDEETYAEVDRQAQELGLGRAAFIRMIIMKYLQEGRNA